MGSGGEAVLSGAGGVFATTHWSVVLKAGASGAAQGREALETLCRAYWFPVYAHVRRRGYSAHDAQDLVQGFFALLIGRDAFQSLSPGRGRFRSFLLAALGNYLADERAREWAAKRGGGQSLVSLDETVAEERYAMELGHGVTPEKEFDRRWAAGVLERAVDALGREQAAAGKAKLFEGIRRFLTDPTEGGDYSVVAAELNMAPNTVAVAVGRLRRRYRELVRAEVSQTLADPSDTDAEMRHLLEAMRGG